MVILDSYSFSDPVSNNPYIYAYKYLAKTHKESK